MRAPQWLTTALKALWDVGVLRLQRWKRGWSRSFPAVDAKWLAGARDENRLKASHESAQDLSPSGKSLKKL